MIRALAYRQQVQQHGDLDRATLQALDAASESPGSPTEIGPSPKPGSAPPAVHSGLRTGTMLVREHEGVLHRVMVLEGGFAWNGATYDSLSQVAFAITGTKWNGPRFFGLRQKSVAKAEDDTDRSDFTPALRRSMRASQKPVSPVSSAEDQP